MSAVILDHSAAWLARQAWRDLEALATSPGNPEYDEAGNFRCYVWGIMRRLKPVEAWAWGIADASGQVVALLGHDLDGGNVIRVVAPWASETPLLTEGAAVADFLAVVPEWRDVTACSAGALSRWTPRKLGGVA